MNMAKTLHF